MAPATPQKHKYRSKNNKDFIVEAYVLDKYVKVVDKNDKTIEEYGIDYFYSIFESAPIEVNDMPKYQKYRNRKTGKIVNVYFAKEGTATIVDENGITHCQYKNYFDQDYEMVDENEKSVDCTVDHGKSKYKRLIQDVDNDDIITVDVYCVLKAFTVTCPARQHAIKKLLCSGIRGKGSVENDLKEAIVALERAIKLEEQRVRGSGDGKAI